jgi:hypothetical protein
MQLVLLPGQCTRIPYFILSHEKKTGSVSIMSWFESDGHVQNISKIIQPTTVRKLSLLVATELTSKYKICQAKLYSKMVNST